MRTQRRAGAGSNQESLRRHNLGTLLRHVHRAGTISRAELTSLMGLNRSTIAGLTGELESLGVTERTLPTGARQGAGRPSAGVRPAPDGPYVIAVELGVDAVDVARVALGGRIMERACTTLPERVEAWHAGASIAGLVRRVVATAPADAPMVGIGIAVPGLVRRSDGLVRLAPNLDWHDVSLSSIVLAALGIDVPVLVGNDANLGALAEHERGAGVGVDDLIFVSGNVGVGAGVILGGHPLDGSRGYAGEIGHVRFLADGRPCHCGNVGCWESAVGAHAIAEAIGCPASQVVRLGEVLAELQRPPAALSDIAAALGSGLGTLVNTFDPSVIVLGGYFRPLFELVGPEISRALSASAIAATVDGVTLTAPGLGGDSELLGAAELAFGQLFADPVAALGAAVVDVGSRVAG